MSEGNLDTLELMMSDDLTVHILTEIRDAVLGTNQRLDQTRTELRAEIGELRGTVGELRGAVGELGGAVGELRGEIGNVRDHVVEAELRLATRFVEMTAASRDVHKLLIDRFDLRDRVERIEQDVAELKKRSS